MKIHTFHPTNIGYTPTGYQFETQRYNSQIFLGKDLNSEFEGIGFGPEGRPNVVERVVINLTKTNPDESTVKVGQIDFDATGLAYILERSNFGPSIAKFEIKEIAVCEAGVVKNMLILGTSPYPTGWKPGY